MRFVKQVCFFQTYYIMILAPTELLPWTGAPVYVPLGAGIPWYFVGNPA